MSLSTFLDVDFLFIALEVSECFWRNLYVLGGAHSLENLLIVEGVGFQDKKTSLIFVLNKPKTPISVVEFCFLFIEKDFTHGNESVGEC